MPTEAGGRRQTVRIIMQQRMRFDIAAGLTLACLFACGRPIDRSPRAASDTTVSSDDSAVISALDSCGGDSREEPRWSGVFRSFDRHVLFVPDSARMLTNPNTGQLDISWPRCGEYCRLSVAVYSDSGISLEARVARIVAEQRRIDSVNRDPQTNVMEFDELDAPPRPFTTPAGPGYQIDHSCGDCAATTLKFAHEGMIADVSVSADAMPGAGERMCEMTVVARSFAWRP